MRRRLTVLFVLAVCVLLAPLAFAPAALANDPGVVTQIVLGVGYGGSTVTATGDYAYVGGYGGLQVVDIDDPDAPVLVGGCYLPEGEYPYGPYDFAVSGAYVYVAKAHPDTGFLWHGTLQVVDVSDPTAPVPVGSCALSDAARGIAVVGKYAYVPARTAGLQVIDVSDPTAPVAVGSCPLPDSPEEYDVAVAGGRAYVLTSYTLQVVDVSDPTAPAAAGSCDVPFNYDSPSGPGSLVVVGDVAYASRGWAGLQVIDVSDSMAPEVIGAWDPEASVASATVVGDHAYVASSFGLYVVDVSTPATPFTAGTCPSMQFAGVAVAGTYAYAIGDSTGLFSVIDLDPGEITGITPDHGETGAEVVIEGVRLGTAGTVRFDDVEAAASAWSDTSITCTVPAGLRTGARNVTVTPGDGATSNAFPFTVEGAQLTSLTPDHGANGATVVIAGTKLGNSGTVRFGETEAATSAWSETEITCTVPEGLGLGVTGVTVTPTGSAISNELSFTVESPQLTALSPDHALTGATVIITGSQLGTSGIVRFGETEATTSAWSETEITCTVPESLPDGSTSVTVSPSGRATSNALPFTVDTRVVTLTAVPKPAVVAYKGRVTISGELRDGLGGLLPGRTLVLQRSFDGNTWRDFKSVTSETGAYSTTTTIVRKTYFRWSFAGDGVYLFAVSPECSAISRASLTPPAVPSTVRHGVKYICSGYLRPQHTGGRAPLTISFYRYSGGRWRSMGGLTDSRWRNVSGATKYTIWLKIPANLAGKWRVRTVHKDADHAKTTSSWRTFTVK